MSSLLFRAALGQAARLGAPKCATNFVKLDFSVFLPSASSCRSKALVTLSSPVQRNYSTQNDENTKDPNKIIGDKEVIYTGVLANNIFRIKFLSLGTSFFGVAMQPLVYLKALSAGEVNSFTLPLFALIGVFAIATPFLLNIVSKKYILQIDYDSKTDKYIAHLYNLILIRKKIEFTPEDVSIPAILGMFTSCAIKGNPVFMDAKFFTDQGHYIRIMGYDKPLNLQIETTQSPQKKDNNNN